jgi:hypothetical protein
MQIILENLSDVLKTMSKQQKKAMRRIRKIYEMLEESKEALTLQE